MAIVDPTRSVGILHAERGVYYAAAATSVYNVAAILPESWAMIQGLRTAIYPTPDLTQGKEWYRHVLGQDPYFDQPFYVGFAVGGFELGLIPDGEPSATGVQVYWGVADAAAELARLTALGAAVHESVKDVGGGIKVAQVRDPFGNLFGIIENPHFKRDEVR